MNVSTRKSQNNKIQDFYHTALCSICAVMLFYALLADSNRIQSLIGLCVIFSFFSASHLMAARSLVAGTNITVFTMVDGILTGALLAYLIFDPLSSTIVLFAFAAVLKSCQGKEKLFHILMLGMGMSISTHAFSENTPPSDEQKLLVLALAGVFLLAALFQQQGKNRQLSDKLQTADTLNDELSNRVFHLAKYFSPTLRSAVLTGNRSHQHAEEKHLTIFFSDLKGFTELAEQLPPDQLGEFLSIYLSQMSDIAIRFGGTIDKIIGDSMMAFFGDPETKGENTDAVNCVAMAITMQAAMEDLTGQWREQGIDNPPSLRIGINSGLCKVGHFGTAQHFNYTLLGRSVNLASRLESAAAENEILISLSTYNLVKDRIDCHLAGELSVKGFNQPLISYRVTQLKVD